MTQPSTQLNSTVGAHLDRISKEIQHSYDISPTSEPRVVTLVIRNCRLCVTLSRARSTDRITLSAGEIYPPLRITCGAEEIGTGFINFIHLLVAAEWEPIQHSFVLGDVCK